MGKKKKQLRRVGRRVQGRECGWAGIARIKIRWSKQVSLTKKVTERRLEGTGY